MCSSGIKFGISKILVKFDPKEIILQKDFHLIKNIFKKWYPESGRKIETVKILNVKYYVFQYMGKIKVLTFVGFVPNLMHCSAPTVIF